MFSVHWKGGKLNCSKEIKGSLEPVVDKLLVGSSECDAVPPVVSVQGPPYEYMTEKFTVTDLEGSYDGESVILSDFTDLESVVSCGLDPSMDETSLPKLS